MEAQLDNGLIIGHAYSITDVRMVSLRVMGQSRDIVFPSTIRANQDKP